MNTAATMNQQVGIDPTQVYAELERFFDEVKRRVASSMRPIRQYLDNNSVYDSAIGRFLAGRRIGEIGDSQFFQGIRQRTTRMMRTSFGALNQTISGAGSQFKQRMQGTGRAFQDFMKKTADSVNSVAKQMAGFFASTGSPQMGGGGGSKFRASGLGKVMDSLRKVGGSAWKGMKWLGGKVKTGLGLLGGAALGFMLATHSRGVANYEQQQQARLQALQSLGPNFAFTQGRIGTQLGYTTPQQAQLLSQAGRQGALVGGGAGRYALLTQRALGDTSILGGITTRQNQGGASGARKAFRQLNRAFTVGLETGLQRARISEMLQAANQLSEQQILVTPGKDQFKKFSNMLGLMQMGGLKGRYAGDALSGMNTSLQQAQGFQQTFYMRAFGFGRGKGILGSLMEQEKGMTPKNFSAIMEQLMREYGKSPGGGLSLAGKLSFKGLGLGSVHMAEKMSELYQKMSTGQITKVDAQKEFQAIKRKDGLKNMTRLEIDAYTAMAKQGHVTVRVAKRFKRLADVGAQNYKAVQAMDRVHKATLKVTEPLMKVVAEEMPKLLNSLVKSGFFNALSYMVRHGVAAISKALSIIMGGMRGYFHGSQKQGVMGKIMSVVGLVGIPGAVVSGLYDFKSFKGRMQNAYKFASAAYDKNPFVIQERAKEARLKKLRSKALKDGTLSQEDLKYLYKEDSSKFTADERTGDKVAHVHFEVQPVKQGNTVTYKLVRAKTTYTAARPQSYKDDWNQMGQGIKQAGWAKQ